MELETDVWFPVVLSVSRAVFGYVPKSGNVIKVDSTGSGFDDLVEEFSEGKVQFGYYRVMVKGAAKFVYIAWCGDGVTGMAKGSFGNHSNDFGAYLKKDGYAMHHQVNARSESDLDEKKIGAALVKAAGANYDAGAKKQGMDSTAKAMGELKTFHISEQARSVETGTGRDGTGVQIDKNASDAYWSSNKAAAPQAAPVASSKPAVDEEARKAFWQQQQQEKAAAAKAPPAGRPAPATGASNLRSKFESGAANTAAPAPSSGPPSRPAPGKVNAAAFNAAPSSAPPSSGPPPARPAPGKVNAAAFNAPPTSAPPTAAPPSGARPAPGGPPPPISRPPPVSGAPPVPPSAPPTAPEPAHEEEWAEAPAPAQEEYAQEEYAASGQEEYAQEEYAASGQEEYAQEEYAQEEYAQEEYAATGQEEYAQEEYAQEEYAAYTQVQALHDYQGQHAEDLSFNAGDWITVHEKDESGWWKGEVNGVTGYFPSNFVQQ